MTQNQTHDRNRATDSGPNRRPFLYSLGTISVAASVAAIATDGFDVVLIALAAISALLLTIIAFGSENYRDREIRMRQLLAQQAASKIAELAWQDEETGLYTISWFRQALEREISRLKRYEHACVVIYLNLDTGSEDGGALSLANVDQSYLWRFVTDLARASVRDTDVVARNRGEYSLAVLLPQSDAEGAKIVLNRLSQRLERELFELVDGTKTQLSFTHQIGAYPVDGSDVDEILAAAGRSPVSISL